MKEKLKELKQEQKRRRAAFEKWKKERMAFIQKCQNGYSPEPGELANFFDGLTPKGFDAMGRKISFVERGKDILCTKKRISDKVIKIHKLGKEDW